MCLTTPVAVSDPSIQAQEKGLFVMEGMWTRFFPAVMKAEEIVRSGTIGKVVAVHSDFGFNGADVASYPDHMFYNLNLGGGGLFYVAPYPVAAALQFLGPDRPTRIAAAGVKDKLTGVDLSGAISLHFEGKGIASLTYNIEVRSVVLFSGGDSSCPFLPFRGRHFPRVKISTFVDIASDAYGFRTYDEGPSFPAHSSECIACDLRDFHPNG